MKRNGFVLLLVFGLVMALPAWGAPPPSSCQQVGGVLMTNIGAIAETEGGINLGPVFGDLKGAVAAKVKGGDFDAGFDIQHYWVTASGESIYFKLAHLTPTFPLGRDGSNQYIVAVPWGFYRSDIAGGTGKFAGATGYLDYFGMADFIQSTLVLRYRGQVCYAH
jgi:hypothetical protein